MLLQKNANLEFIRGFACLLVLISHLCLLHPVIKAIGMNIISNWGTEAVIIFFILSGVVINYAQSSNPKSSSQFLLNRVIRLYPQFLVGILLSLFVIKLQGLSFPSFKDIILNGLMLSTLQGYIAPSISTNPPIWSLTFEMFFYFIFSISIGKHQKKIIHGWFILSLLVMPFYFMPLKFGAIQHFIAMLSFSSIWLVGYLIYAYRNQFYVETHTALLSVGLLPLVSRLHLSEQFYDPLKFLIFAIIAIPFFRFCLQGKQKGIKINFSTMLATYIALVFLLFFNSHSLGSSKILYSIVPILLVGLHILANSINLKKKIAQNALKTGIIIGKYSYSLYITHYPIMFVCAYFMSNVYVFLFFSISLVSLFAWLLEAYFQKYMNIYLRYTTSNKINN